MATALASIKLLAMDVDGVLTDGRIILGEDGVERRNYHARDGIGLRLAQAVGLELAIITSSPSEGIRTRGERLRINHIRIAVADKEAELRQLASKLQLSLTAVAFVGDDLVDLPAMRLAGLAIAVADAEMAVRDQADLVTTRPGGHGAMREVCELLVAAHDPNYLAEKHRCGLRL